MNPRGRREIVRADRKISSLLRGASVGMCASLFVGGGPARAETEPTVDVALRGGLVSSTNFDVAAGGLLDGEVGYRLTPAWRSAAYMGWATVRSTSSADSTQQFEAVRFGARGAWHMRPARTLDPWAGISFGGFRTTGVSPGRWGAELGFDVGLDVRIAPRVVIGPAFALMIPLGNGQLHPWTTPVGGYFSGIPVNVPLPLLRIAVAF